MTHGDWLLGGALALDELAWRGREGRLGPELRAEILTGLLRRMALAAGTARDTPLEVAIPEWLLGSDGMRQRVTDMIVDLIGEVPDRTGDGLLALEQDVESVCGTLGHAELGMNRLHPAVRSRPTLSAGGSHPDDDPHIVFVPLRLRHGGGALLWAEVRLTEAASDEVDLQPADADDWTSLARPNDWEPFDHDFRGGVRDGLAGALKLLRRYHVDEEVLRRHRRLTMRLHGLLPPAEVGGGSVGLPVALAVIAIVARATAAGAGLGAPRMAVTGAVEPEALGLRPVHADYVTAKLQALRRDGRFTRLLAWTDGRPTGRDGLLIPERPGLEAAAAACWDTGWHEFKRRTVERHLRAISWTITWPGDVADANARHVPVAEEDDLFAHFTDRERVAVVAGWPNTGKTHLLAGLANRLQDAGWLVHYTVPAGHRLTPDPTAHDDVPDEDLVDLLRPLVGDGPADRKVLLILDDIRSVEDDQHVAAISTELSEHLGVAVLTAIRFDDRERVRWRTEEVFQRVLRPPRDDVGVDFLRRMRARYGLRLAEEQLPVIARYAGGDIYWLVRTADWFSQRAEGERSDEQARPAAVLSREVGDMTPEQLDHLRDLAALSYIGIATPEHEMGWIAGEFDLLSRLGGRPRRIGRTVHWELASRLSARWLLTREAEPLGSSDAFMGTLLTRLSRLMSRYGSSPREADAAMALYLIACVGREDERLRARLVERWKDELVHGFRRQRAVHIASLLWLIGDALGSEERSVLLDSLVNQSLVEIPDPMTARELSFILRVIRRHQDVAETPASGRDSPMQKFLSRLQDGGLTRLLAKPSSADDRLKLAVQLWNLYLPETHALLRDNVELFLSRLRPDRSTHYQTALQLARWAQRLADGHPQESLRTVLKPLLAEPTRNVPLPIYLEWVALQCHFDPDADFEPWILEAGRRLHGARVTAHFLRQALLHLAAQKWDLVNKLLNQGVRRRSRGPAAGLMPAAMAHILGEASGGAAAQLINTLRGLHAQYAWWVLYEARDQPRMALYQRLLKRAREDPRAAGQLLQAVARVDTSFGVPATGFAHRLAEELGRENVMAVIDSEHRLSMLSHLFRGLALAHASYLPEVVPVLVYKLADAIRESHRQWAPQLALQIADDCPGLGVLEMLRDVLDRDAGGDRRLLDRMVSPLVMEALVSFHRLGNALYPDIAGRFSDEELPEGWPLDMVGANYPDVLARAYAEVSETLRRAGRPERGRELLAAVNGAGDGWAGRLAQARTAGGLAMALDTLRRLDPTLVREVVPRLADQWPDRRRARERPTANRIADLMRRWLDQPQAAVHLLVALEQSAPGEGRRTLLELRRMGSEWTYFSHALADLQDPRAAAHAYRQLTELFQEDGLPSERDRENVIGKWRRQLEALRSPAAISDVLRAYAAWNAPAAAAAGASAVDLDAVIDRVARSGYRDLARGGYRDLAGAVSLASTFLALELHEPARLLARTAIETPSALAQMDLRSAARLLDVLVGVDEALALGQCDAAWERVAEESRVDPSISVAQHADLLGWLAFQARRLGQCPAEVRGVVPPVWHGLRPGERGWAAGCLPWANQEAWDAFRAGSVAPPASPADAFAVVFLATRFGRLHSLLEADEDVWIERLATGKAVRLAALLQMQSPQLRSLLERHAERLRAVLRPWGPGADLSQVRVHQWLADVTSARHRSLDRSRPTG